MKAAAYRVSPFPHWRAADNAVKIFWSRNAALVPLLLVYAAFFHLEALRLLAVTLLSAFVCETAAAKIFKRKARFQSGFHIHTALLFALLLPPSTPSIAAAAGVCVAILLGSEIFGGAGAALFVPAILGHAFLQLAYPDIFLRGGVLSIHSAFGVWTTAGALFLSAAILGVRRAFYWQASLFYFGVLLLLEKLLVLDHEISLRRLFFAALFLLTDPIHLPLTPRARLLFAMIAAAATHFLRAYSSVSAPEIFALLSVGLLTPWLDQWIVPAGAAKTKEMTKI